MRQQYKDRGYQEVYISFLFTEIIDITFNSIVVVPYFYLIGVEPKYLQYATMGNFWTRRKL
jgi:hypothetical protein